MALPDRRLRILVADDHAVIRKLLRTTLEQHPQLEVCAEAGDGATAIKTAKEVKPDVVILDLNMPVLNGFEAAREIKNDVPQAAIVIASSHVDKAFVEAAKRVGVRAYVAKTKVGVALVKAIEAALANEDFVAV